MKQQEIDTAQAQYADRIKIYVLLGGLLVMLSAALLLVRNNGKAKSLCTFTKATSRNRQAKSKGRTSIRRS